MRSGLYTGSLLHARHAPARNVFRYRVCFYVLDLDEVPELERRLALFSHNRFNAVSLHDRDYFGPWVAKGRRAGQSAQTNARARPARPEGRRRKRRLGAPLKEAVLAYLAASGIDLAGGRVLLLTNLRVLGYVFNPVSFFFCYRADGGLECVVAEVNNTFGEQLPTLLSEASRIDGGRAPLAYRHEKRLHVSPFFGLEQEYEFSFEEPGERAWARIDVYEESARVLHTVLHGRRQELTNASLARALLRYPLMPVQVITLIHWQALKLFLKRAPFHRKPPFEAGKGSLRA